MAGSARVQSIQELAELRAFLITLADQINTGLQTAHAEVAATERWLHHMQPAKWKSECERAQRRFQDATETLRRKRLSPGTDGRPPSTMVEQKALREAKARLDHAQAKAQATAQWQRRFDKQMHEHRRAAQATQALVDSMIPQAVRYLDKLGEHLEKYVQTAFTPMDLPGGEVSGTSAAPPVSTPRPEADAPDEEQP